MTDISVGVKAETMNSHSPGVVLRSLIIGLTAFLTVVDLFATQAILPSLTKHYNVTPAAMGFAVNASTFTKFQEMLDRPLPASDKLRRLLKTKAPWEK